MFDKMKSSLNKTKATIGLCLVIFAAVLWIIYVVLPFHIVRTNPSSQNVATLTPFFNIEFNKPLSTSGLSVSSNYAIIKFYKVQQKTLSLTLNYPLTAGATYAITVNSVQAVGGHKISNKTFKFTPKNITYDKLSADQKAVILKGQSQNEAAYNNPILAHLPYGTLDYNLTATFVTVSGQTKLELNAQLLLSEADLSSLQSEQVAITQYESEVTQYITSLGLNPSNYTINYRY